MELDWYVSPCYKTLFLIKSIKFVRKEKNTKNCENNKAKVCYSLYISCDLKYHQIY